MKGSIKQFTIYWCDLEPTFGHQLQKTRPCAVVSPSDMNDILGTVIVVPLTSSVRSFPFYIPVNYKGRSGALACDQIKIIDQRRVGDQLADMSQNDAQDLSRVLQKMFAVKKFDT